MQSQGGGDGWQRELLALDPWDDRRCRGHILARMPSCHSGSTALPRGL